MEDFEGRCAVVTGGGGIIGRGLAVAFGRAGMNVVVSSLHGERARETADQVSAVGAKAVWVQADVTDPASMDHLVDRAYDKFGQVDILINNAGTKRIKPFVELTHQDWSDVLSVQWDGVLNGILAFLPRMLQQGGERHIVNTASMSGVGRADLRVLNAPYVTAKFAVVGLSEVMAPALAPHGITVSVLCPGLTVADDRDASDGSGQPSFRMPSAHWYERNVLTADQVAQETLTAIRAGRFYIFPHQAGRGEVEGRHLRLMEGFDQAAATSPPVSEGTAVP